MRRTVAEAHETAWSRSKVASDDELVDSNRYLLDASRHRDEALGLYAEGLASAPDSIDLHELRARLARLRIDVDTRYRRSWCLWDGSPLPPRLPFLPGGARGNAFRARYRTDLRALTAGSVVS